jgi:coenzyme Q-binding protein COQ10
MAAVVREVVIDAPIEKLYGVIVDYERYPEFVPGIKSVRVRTQGAEKHVEYELDLGVKKIRYTLRLEEARPTRVRWSLVSGDLMKVSNGSWELSPDGQRTRARYAVELQASKPPLVPQALIDRVSDELTKVQLPRTLDAFKARAEQR